MQTFEADSSSSEHYFMPLECFLFFLFFIICFETLFFIYLQLLTKNPRNNDNNYSTYLQH